MSLWPHSVYSPGSILDTSTDDLSGLSHSLMKACSWLKTSFIALAKATCSSLLPLDGALLTERPARQRKVHRLRPAPPAEKPLGELFRHEVPHRWRRQRADE